MTTCFDIYDYLDNEGVPRYFDEPEDASHNPEDLFNFITVEIPDFDPDQIVTFEEVI